MRSKVGTPSVLAHWWTARLTYPKTTAGLSTAVTTSTLEPSARRLLLMLARHRDRFAGVDKASGQEQLTRNAGPTKRDSMPPSLTATKAEADGALLNLPDSLTIRESHIGGLPTRSLVVDAFEEQSP